MTCHFLKKHLGTSKSDGGDQPPQVQGTDRTETSYNGPQIYTFAVEGADTLAHDDLLSRKLSRHIQTQFRVNGEPCQLPLINRLV